MIDSSSIDEILFEEIDQGLIWIDTEYLIYFTKMHLSLNIYFHVHLILKNIIVKLVQFFVRLEPI